MINYLTFQLNSLYIYFFTFTPHIILTLSDSRSFTNFPFFFINLNLRTLNTIKKAVLSKFLKIL